MIRWIGDRVGIVRLRQWGENLAHRISFLPIVFVGVAVVLCQTTLWVDRELGDTDLPGPLSTTVDSARPVFATIAGGLITAVTLLMSMMLIAVQLASANFSPRTLRNWLGDATLRRSIALVMATIVYCLLGLRAVGTTDGAVQYPTVTVLTAVLLALASLIAVIRAVDHVTTNMQVGTVTRRLVDQTLSTLATSRELMAGRRPDPASLPGGSDAPRGGPHGEGPPDDAVVIESSTCGWIQQIDEQILATAVPDGAHVWIDVAHGVFVMEGAPLARVTTAPAGDPADRDTVESARSAFAIGENRTMQQDVGFGIGQLADIAIRALSPGVNDPATAEGVVANLGEVLLEVWSHESADDVVDRDGRTIHRVVADHEAVLRAALDGIRHHARTDPAVTTTLVGTILTLRAEVVRRELPGPLDPLDRFVDDVVDGADTSTWLDRERTALVELASTSR